MEWRDEGILLCVRRHGESSAIIEVLTSRLGRHAGLVRGGAGKTHGPVLQPGAQLSLEWNARLADHLGTFKVDLIRARAAAIMADRDALAALNAVSALIVRLLPEREPNPAIYAATLALVNALGAVERSWPARYAAWELTLLDALGFGLDLESCAATGQRDELVYVSPRSGRAVSHAAGAPYAASMLPLPQFLIGGGPPGISPGIGPGIGEVREALRLTGYFLKSRVCPAFELDQLPGARTRLVRLLGALEMTAPPADAEEPAGRPEEDGGELRLAAAR
jgi:DNA repair protein RecO (recombination protein O)